MYVNRDGPRYRKFNLSNSLDPQYFFLYFLFQETGEGYDLTSKK